MFKRVRENCIVFVQTDLAFIRTKRRENCNQNLPSYKFTIATRFCSLLAFATIETRHYETASYVDRNHLIDAWPEDIWMDKPLI